ncbi:MAG: Cof-type HAD-IIB family hydrolase [Clostridia bacterium]|nr:Cof-type HAD-IIB family hydrolase [Clostridia bacterium]
MYKLIAIDLDGTLLNSKKHISQEDKDAIRFAIAQGVKIVICSGRIFAGVKIFARQLEIKGPIIACNGALISDAETGDILYSNPLKVEDCIRVIELCREEGIYFHVYAGETMLAEKLEFSSLFYQKRNEFLPEEERIKIRIVDNVGQVLRAETDLPYKLVAISEEQRVLRNLRSKVQKISGVEVVSSNYDNFEVMNSGVNKGAALKFISEILGIKREETIAIGDNENDDSMIRFAGLGVAMGNAEDSIKRISQYVTKANEECGVAEVIRKYIKL